MFKAISDPRAPVNEGWFRPLRVICPEGTVFTARRPAPVSTYWETGAYAVDLIWRALFPVLPDRLSAGHALSVCGTLISGRDDEGKTFILVEPQAGGWGATATRDGESGLVPVGDGETYIMPVEICESRFPLLVDRFTFNLTPAGAGKFRGGFGLIREYRMLCDSAQLTTTFGRHRFPPWGGADGGDGSVNGAAVLRAGQDEPTAWRGKFTRFPLQRGDVARLITAVGGGYGDPLTREPALVIQDVQNELLTPGEASSIYGIVLDPDTLAVNTEQTIARRRELGANREHRPIQEKERGIKWSN